MEYSPVKTFRLKNFRNIGDITLDFTDSPIITLTGENEAGKTSVVKGFAVIGLHAWTKEQKDFIRDGTIGFGLVIELEDGTIITRVKNNSANIYEVMKKDGSKWNTTKIDAAGVPVQVQEVMGLIEEPETNEFLHVRTYEDKLLFVITPASTNYKVMYNALKVDNLTKAIKNGSTSVNKLNSTFESNNNSMSTLLTEVRKIRLYDIEPAVNIKNRLIKEWEQLQKIKKAAELYYRIQEIDKELGAIAEIGRANLQAINTTEVARLSSISRNVESVYNVNKLLSIYSKIGTLQNIDTASINKLKGTIEKIRILQGLNDKVILYENLKSVSSIELPQAIKMHEAIIKRDSLSKINEKIAKTDVSGLQEVDVTPITHLIDAVRMMNRLLRIQEDLSKINIDTVESIRDKDIEATNKLKMAIQLNSKTSNLLQEIDDIEAEKDKYNKLIRESGALVAECPKCGEPVVVDTRAYI